MEPELIADYRCVTGEGPLWHPDEQRLYWVDIPEGRMFRYEPATGHHEMCYEGEVVGGFTVQTDGSLLLLGAKGSVRTWRDGEMQTIIEQLPDEGKSRFNDCIADPRGRVFGGTMSTSERAGRLYRLDPDGTITLILEGVGTANGMGFTPDGKHMYFTDSRTHEIYLFEYDEETGAIGNKRVFARVPESEGVPDGLTVDAEGYVWSARWGGARVVRHTPFGSEDMHVSFPAESVSSVTFGGKDYTDIYVTTANGEDKERYGAGAGALFRLNLGIRGVAEFRSRIGI